MASGSNDSGSSKKVLVVLGEHRRPVSFSAASRGEYASLVGTVREVFQIAESSRVQLKDENWGGEFTDVDEDEEIADKSVFRVVVEPSPKVSRSSYLLWCAQPHPHMKR